MDGVESGTLANLVHDEPEGQASLDGGILADATDKDVVGTLEHAGHGIDVRTGVVHDRDAGGSLEGRARLIGRNRLGKLDVHALGMATQHGNAYGGRCHLDVGVAKDLRGLDDHLPLFLGVRVVHEDVDMRNDVERDLVRKRLDGKVLAVQVLARLLVKLVHRLEARTTCGLVGAHDDALDATREIVERLERDDHLDGRAIGIGDDARMPLEVLRVDLGDDQRHVIVDAKRARVVDHDTSRIHHGLAIFLGGVASAGKQRDVDALEARRRHLFDHELPIAKLDGATSRTSRGKRLDLGRREFALREYLEHLASDNTRGACHGNDGMCGHNLVPSHVRSSQDSI